MSVPTISGCAARRASRSRGAGARKPKRANRRSRKGRLVFEFGVNDAREVNGKRQLEAAQSLAAAREILAAAIAWKPTLMIGPPPGGDEARNERVKELSDAMADLCALLGVPYFDSFAPLLAASPTFIPSTKAVDGTHPNAAGYAEWARRDRRMAGLAGVAALEKSKPAANHGPGEHRGLR